MSHYPRITVLARYTQAGETESGWGAMTDASCISYISCPKTLYADGAHPYALDGSWPPN